MDHALHHGRYLAGNDDSRALDLMNAFTSSEYSGVICTRGGYGSARLLPLLDFDALRKADPKIFVGFSDITALQSALWQECQLISFSGPQLARGFGNNQMDIFSKNFWFAMLRGELWNTPLAAPDNSEWMEPRRHGAASGTLLGGNLAVLTSLCGTRWTPSFKNAVVILEEIDEPPYRIDRMITQLVQSGCFEGVRGVLLGAFSQNTKEGSSDWGSLAAEVIGNAIPDIPVAYGAPYGHTGPCWTLPLGAHAEIDVDRKTFSVSLPPK